MTDLPAFAQLVSNVPANIAFYTEKLGFTLQDYQSDEDIATILDPDGDQLLLAGPAAENLSTYLSESPLIFKPGESLDFHGEDLEATRTELLRRGVAESDISLVERRSGTKLLRIQGPDAYVFTFIYPASVPTKALLAQYAQAPDELDAALAGLMEDDLDLSLNAESWSIRQIVHHLADADILFGELMKVALSAPGAVMIRPRPVGNERIATAPEYRRPIASSVELFRAFHAHIVEIANHVPDVDACYIVDPEDRRHNFGDAMVGLICGHTEEHLEEIWAIRHKHGKTNIATPHQPHKPDNM